MQSDEAQRKLDITQIHIRNKYNNKSNMVRLLTNERTGKQMQKK